MLTQLFVLLFFITLYASVFGVLYIIFKTRRKVKDYVNEKRKSQNKIIAILEEE